jgi:K+-transporting ATPase ATPase C chain
MFKPLLPTLRLVIVLAVVTGIVFPLVVTVLAQLIFSHAANGSLIARGDGKVIGSSLIGQAFSRPEYFHPRPSAAGSGYAAEASSGTNLGPTSAKLVEGGKDFPGIKQLAKTYRQENALDQKSMLPADCVTRSGSGLDPHISPENALLQMRRVAKSRNLKESVVTQLVQQHIEYRQLGFMGEPRVNVLLLNIAVDKLRP